MPTTRQRLVSLFTRRYPFLSGCASFANCRLVHSLTGHATGVAWTRLDCGARILVPLNDYVGRAAFFVGDLDRKISEVIRRIVRPGDQVLDVGANLGVVTLLLARLIGTTGIVHAFEPNPTVAKMLGRSIERNRLANVKLHRIALGNEDGTATLSFPSDNAGMGTLTQSEFQGNQVVVPVRSLDSIAPELKIDRVRLLKIDVEGFEPAFFRGAKRWMSDTPPESILFESNREDGSDEVTTMIADHGYRLYAIPKRLFNLAITPWSRGTASHDVLAVRKDCEREIISKFVVER